MSTVPHPNSVLASSSEIAGNKARNSQIQSSWEDLSSYASDQAFRQGEEDRKPSARATNHKKPTKRQTTIYDAVAGRVGSNGFTDAITRPIKLRNGFPSIETAFAPLEILLRRVAAPIEGRADVYLADENLEPYQKLPDSELLKAVHAYTSDFYSIRTEDKGKCDFRSLDETALIALGVLLEEISGQVLGETGDMVLVEPEVYDDFVPESRATQMQISGRVPQTETPPYVSEDSSDESDDDEEIRERKRRRP